MLKLSHFVEITPKFKFLLSYAEVLTFCQTYAKVIKFSQIMQNLSSFANLC
jgi:hypothetical protein